MTKSIVQFSLLFVILVLAQAIVFNNICLFNVAVPFVFIYFIISLPITLSPNGCLNALACTLIAMSRRSILHLYFPREDELTIPEPSIKSLGMEVYVKYLFTLVLLYCTIIFLIEAFSFFNVLQLALRILCSTLLSFLLLLGLDSIMSQSR